MENKIFEKKSEKGNIFNKEELKKLQPEEKCELEIKMANNYINMNKKYNEFHKKDKLYSYIICFVNIIYFYFFEKTKENKILFNRNETEIKMNVNNNGFLEFKKILKKDLYYTGKKVYIKNDFKKNIKKNRITNKKRNTYVILMIFYNLIGTNNNMIDFNFSNITLKIKGPGYQNILYSNFHSYKFPNIIYINGNQNYTITNRYYFNEINNIVDLIWNEPIDNCAYMFCNCSNITEIDLSTFDTSFVINMFLMFDGCSRLASLDISNLNTVNVKTMHRMFGGCSQLSSLNVSSFNTINVTDMGGMFQYCSKLTSLNVSNFNTSNVVYMNSMFCGCSQLTSLDLSNFNTSKVINMHFMFSNCLKLTSLNLSNFDTIKVESMNGMFSSCSKLEYINLKNFRENDSLTVYYIFTDISDNIVVCLNENIIKISQKIKEKNCYTMDCSDNWEINKKKLVSEANICFDSSNNNIFYNYEYQGLYYENCINGNLINNKTINYCKCENEKCQSCSDISLLDNLYEIENDDFSNGYKKCYKDPIGYYLDVNDHIYKKCYYSCKKCEIKGNNTAHNCTECDDNYPLKFIVNNYSNCYQNCSYYYYFDKYFNIHCTINNICPDEYPLLDELECKKSYVMKNMIDHLTNNKSKNKEEEIKYYDKILDNLEEVFTSKNYNTSDLDKGKDEIVEIEKMKVILTTTKNQKDNINNNNTNIDLGECEQSLRQTYNLTNDEILYIKMLEIFQEGMKISKIEYDVYAKLDGEKLTKLSLNSCENDKISLSIPVNNIDNIDKLNKKSGYYNDFCYTATSDSGTDITLQDRKNEYTSQTVCQDDCDFIYYNYTSKKAKCSCEAKESKASFADMKINKKKLLDNFKDIKNIVNFSILKCYKVLFSKNGISKNIGFFILIAIIIFHSITLFVFYLKEFDLLICKIKNIIFSKNEFQLYKYDKTGKNKKQDNKNKAGIESNKKNKKENKNFKIKFNIINNNIIINNHANNINNKKIKNDKKIQIGKYGKINLKKNKINVFKKSKRANFNRNDIKMKNISDNEIFLIYKKNIKFEKSSKTDKPEKFQSIIDYTDDELNVLSFDLALKNDRRSYCQFYISLLKTKHEFIFTFFYNKDYNSKIMKIDLFFFGFALNYTINGLFFNDDTMHNVYENKGLFDVSYQLPIIVYSSLISMFLGALVQMLGLSNDAIITFKQNKVTYNINKRRKKLIKKLKIIFVLYFILSYILLIFFCYYISMFGAVYMNTQYLLLEDTLMGFAVSFISPFVIYLMPGLFRIPALTAPKKNRRCLYNFSKIFFI